MEITIWGGVFLQFALEGAAFDPELAGGGADVSATVMQNPLEMLPTDSVQGGHGGFEFGFHGCGADGEQGGFDLTRIGGFGEVVHRAEAHRVFAAARHHLRLVSTLVKNEIPYLGPESRTRDATPDQIATAAQATWAVLQRKWRTISGGLDLILDEAQPLGFWCKVMLELHAIDLPQRS